MTSNYHTPLPFEADATTANVNARFSSLDTQISANVTNITSNDTDITTINNKLNGTTAFTPYFSNAYLNAAAGNPRILGWQTGGALRWRMFASGDAESGGNAGTNFFFQRFADDGSTLLGTPMSITRSSGNFTIDAGTGDLQLDGGKIGFFGITPIARPTLNGNVNTQTATVIKNLATILDDLGIIIDASTT